MIEKIVKKKDLKNSDSISDDLNFWLKNETLLVEYFRQVRDIGYDDKLK